MPNAASPVITLTTDFGLDDFYVGAVKGSILRHCPQAVCVDITHHVPRHDVLSGAIMLERAVQAFPDHTIHLAVVDPGVGTDRRIIITRWGGQTVVCPDNGLITWTWRRREPGELWELTWRPTTSSHVFHGRDIMGPAAAMLAAGMPIEQIARRCHDPMLLDVAPATDLARDARILHIDRFGNATTNVPDALLGTVRSVIVGQYNVGPVCRVYGDVAVGEPLALVGSSGLLEIAIREGSAADVLNLKAGDPVQLVCG